VGHAGTLDPPATGLLVMLTGRATRLARFIALLPKRYRGVIKLGRETTTDDATGETVGEPDESWRSRLPAELDAALRNVQAMSRQMPPAVSAKKVGGERAYKKVRRGESPALEAAAVVISRLRCDWFDRASGEVHVDVVCSSGTYVRAIARDVGRELASKAHLASLRRTEIGPWTVEQAASFEAATQPLASWPASAHRPAREAVAHLPALILPAEDARRFATGQKLQGGADDGPVAVFDVEGLLGVARQESGVLHPDVVLSG
jgi:tRNA pseudouridine55 synthase